MLRGSIVLMVATAHASVLTPSALGTTYRALVAGGVGDSFRSVAKVVELPMPTLDEGEVLVKVVYAGVNGGCETFRARGEFAFVGNKDAADGFALGAEGVGDFAFQPVRRIGLKHAEDGAGRSARERGAALRPSEGSTSSN